MVKTIPVKDWEDVAPDGVIIHRLNAADILALLALRDECDTDDEGNLTDDTQKLEWAVEAAARSVVNREGVREFDSVAGREFLLCELAVVGVLVREIMDLNAGLSGSVDEELNTAKKK